jgi:tetraprenyl-beta-curcumene synthase
MTGSDPAPLTTRQVRAVVAGAGRELGWGVWDVKRELGGWRARARAIPDPAIREHALAALDDGRLLVDGAALFWTLTARRRPGLLRLLVALQTLLNYIDIALERESLGAARRPGSWMWLAHDALDITRPPPHQAIASKIGDDGGYLGALVLACRAGCAALPGYSDARPLLLREVERSRAFEIEHDRDAPRRRARLEEHVGRTFGDTPGAQSWELAGGASSLLTAMAVLALASEPDTAVADLRSAADAYVWVASAAALMDSYADRLVDRARGGHNWLDYYDDDDAAAQRAMYLLTRAVHEVSALRHGERHLVIVGCMAALALSSDAARSPALRSTTASLARSGGLLTRALIPVLRAWRVVYERTGD